jgi:hypothetical protein
MKPAFLNRKTARRAGAIALVLAAAASVVTGRERPVPEVVAPGAARPARAAAPALDIDLGSLERATLAAPGNDPFAPRSFAPPPVAQAPAAPQAPSAPPLPFVYIGKVTQDGKTEFYVTRDDDLISIAAGQKIDAEYRVDAITDSSIRFTYLPLKTPQSLELPEAGG